MPEKEKGVHPNRLIGFIHVFGSMKDSLFIYLLKGAELISRTLVKHLAFCGYAEPVICGSSEEQELSDHFSSLLLLLKQTGHSQQNK